MTSLPPEAAPTAGGGACSARAARSEASVRRTRSERTAQRSSGDAYAWAIASACAGFKRGENAKRASQLGGGRRAPLLVPTLPLCVLSRTTGGEAQRDTATLVTPVSGSNVTARVTRNGSSTAYECPQAPGEPAPTEVAALPKRGRSTDAASPVVGVIRVRTTWPGGIAGNASSALSELYSIAMSEAFKCTRNPVRRWLPDDECAAAAR